MTRLSALLFTLASVAVTLLPGAAAAQVRGQVTDGSTGDPVAGALVWLAGGRMHMTRSTADGTYTFTDAPSGSYCLRVDSPGYDTANVCISVSAGASMVVDMPLRVRPVAIAPLVVSGRRGAVARSGVTDDDSLHRDHAALHIALPATRASRLAGAQLGDLTHMPASDPAGGGRPHALYVWGSSAERGRVLLDGATLNAPLHLGALLPPLDPHIVGVADVHSGGISPRYDGGTSYIMDYSTRPVAQRPGVWGEMDLLAGRLGAETPLGDRAGMLVSARRVNDELIDGLVSSKFGYGYADALARADVNLGSGAGVHVTALTTREAVSIPRDLADDRASWRNRAATVEWRHDRAGEASTALLSVSRGVADLPLLSAVGGHLEASLDRFGGIAERRWQSGARTWTAGAELEHLVFRRRSHALQDPITQEPGPVECTTLLPCSHARATFASTFGEVRLQAASGVHARAGARAMYGIESNRMYVMPRASVTILPASRYSVTLAAGRFSQPYVRETPLGTHGGHVDLPIDVDVAQATHLELGVARNGSSTHIRAGAFVRHHDRAEPSARARTVPGADISLEYSTPIGTLSAAYSISGPAGMAREEVEGDTAPQPAPPLQHLATLAFGGGVGRWQMELNTAFGAGLPLTSIVLDQPVDAEVVLMTGGAGGEGYPAQPARSYVRVDAQLGAEWTIRPGIRLTPYVRVINALGQRESLFYFQDDSSANAPHGLARLPAIPIVGVRWHF